MSDLKLVIVEDYEPDIQLCRNAVKDFQEENKITINLVECKTLDEAQNKLDNSFDGIIIDLELNNQGDAGNQVVKQIESLNLRIPVIIMTGTPGAFDSEAANIGVFKKGKVEYAELLNLLWDIHHTGLTRIMGGRGIIEENLNKIFKNFLPQKEIWIKYGKKHRGESPGRTEKALLRHTLNHLLHLLDEDTDKSFPEEMYLHPPATTQLCTGSIVKRKDGEASFVVMNPACDLVIRKNKNPKTDSILTVGIERASSVLDTALDGIKKEDKKTEKRKAVFSNNYTTYYHWLPDTNFFEGGFLNFRKISSISYNDFIKQFSNPEIQIAPSFVKDIVSRFSSYYARQGQPDIDSRHLVNPK